MNSHSKLILAVAAFCAARFAFALSPGETVDNFRLPDHQGGSREMYYFSDMKAVVLMAQGNGCEASRQSVPGLKALRDQYRSQGVEVLLIDSNLNDTSAAIAKAATDQGIDMPILIDETQLIGEALDLRRNASPRRSTRSSDSCPRSRRCTARSMPRPRRGTASSRSAAPTCRTPRRSRSARNGRAMPACCRTISSASRTR
jgi:peroxiredoxin